MKKNFRRCRFFVSAGILLAGTALFAAVPEAEKPTPAWEIREGISQPESAYFDAESGYLFISNVAGSPAEKDGRGWITKALPNGEVVEAKWVSGLNAPKGMRSRGGKLYVTDIDRLVVIDIKEGSLLRSISVKDAKFLNDVAIGPKGKIYISDTLQSRIYRVTPKGRVSVFSKGEKLESPNGLYVRWGRLYIAAWGYTSDWSVKEPGRLLAVGLRKRKVWSLSFPLGNLDGLEAYGDDWLVSDFVAGKVYKILRKGKVETILEGFKGSADIGVIPSQNLVIVPRMNENIVSAYDIGAPKESGRR